MVMHKKTIQRDGPSMKGQGSAGNPEADENGVVGVEHKVPLSEAVLKSVGLYGGTRPAKGRAKGDSGVIDLRDQKGALHLPAPERADCSTVAEVVSFLSADRKGYFERTPIGEGSNARVTVRFTHGEDADIVTGSGKTTKQAVRAMAAKLGESFDCLEGEADV